MNDVENKDKEREEIVEEKTRSLNQQLSSASTALSTIQNLGQGNSAQMIRDMNNLNFHEWEDNDQSFSPAVQPGDYIWEENSRGLFFYKNNSGQTITRANGSTNEYYYTDMVGNAAKATIKWNSNDISEINSIQILDTLFRSQFNAIETLINDVSSIENQHKRDLLDIYNALSALTKPS